MTTLTTIAASETLTSSALASALKRLGGRHFRAMARDIQTVQGREVVIVEQVEVFAADRISGREVCRVVRGAEIASADPAAIVAAMTKELKGEARRAAKAAASDRRQARNDKL